MNSWDKAISRRLKQDPLAEAERITGQRLGDKVTDALGLMLHLEHSQQKEALLDISGDTYFDISFEKYLQIVTNIGFKIVYEQDIHDKYEDKYFIMFHEEYGILLSFDTYRNKEIISGGNMYYNWRPYNKDTYYKHIATGSFWFPSNDTNVGKIWIGSHDCREALSFHIRNLHENGYFITPWVERPFLWLLNYKEARNSIKNGMAEHREDKILLLPNDIQRAITSAI